MLVMLVIRLFLFIESDFTSRCKNLKSVKILVCIKPIENLGKVKFYSMPEIKCY